MEKLEVERGLLHHVGTISSHTVSRYISESKLEPQARSDLLLLMLPQPG